MKEKKSEQLQSHFLDKEYSEMKPKPNVMETTRFYCRTRAHQPNISPHVNSHVEHQCHDTKSKQSNKFATAPGFSLSHSYDTETRLHVQLEPVDFGAMAQRVHIRPGSHAFAKFKPARVLCNVEALTSHNVTLSLALSYTNTASSVSATMK